MTNGERIQQPHTLVSTVTGGCGIQPSDPVPELVAIRGYAAGAVGRGPGANPPYPPPQENTESVAAHVTAQAQWEQDWVLVYLDVTLQRWVLIRECDVVASHRVQDPTLPFGGYDMFWLRRDAPCGQGAGPYSIQARFLAGAFTAAGDLESSPRMGGTYAPPSGLLCDVSTPACCNKSTRC